MKITTVGDAVHVQRRVTVEGGPVVQYPNSKTGKLMRVEHLFVRFTWAGLAGDWVAQHVDLGGTFLRKDGRDSLNTGEYYVTPGGTHRPAPDWVMEIVDLLWPNYIPNLWSGSTETGDPSDG